jgi:putative membrane protein
MWGADWGMMSGSGGGWFGALGMLIWLLVLAILVAGVVWLVRSTARHPDSPHFRERRSPGLDVLEERYARGEINRDEYLQKKRDISG